MKKSIIDTDIYYFEEYNGHIIFGVGKDLNRYGFFDYYEIDNVNNTFLLTDVHIAGHMGEDDEYEDTGIFDSVDKCFIAAIFRDRGHFCFSKEKFVKFEELFNKFLINKLLTENDRDSFMEVFMTGKSATEEEIKEFHEEKEKERKEKEKKERKEMEEEEKQKKIVLALFEILILLVFFLIAKNSR